jgi:hypothetical protein
MKNLSTKEVKQKVEESTKKLYEDLKLGKTDRLKKYMEFLKNFHHYSFYNTILIYCQNPEASRVAGYKAWQRLGYQVKKGEKGIEIFAPQTYKIYRKDGQVLYPFQVNDPDKVKDWDLLDRIRFILVYVFDKNQCDKTDKAEDLVDEYFYPLKGEGYEKKYNHLKSVIEKYKDKKITVEEVEIKPHGAEGYSADGKIVISRKNGERNMFLTLIHEFAHELMHWKKVKDTRLNQEIQAETVSYLVADWLGEENPFSRDYILNFADDSLEMFNLNLKTSVETALNIIKMVTTKVEEEE